MSKIYNYGDFLNEEFFKKIFGRKKATQKKSKIDECVSEIIKFLNDNDIYTWDDFIYSKKADKHIINKIIDASTTNMKELDEIRFRLKIELLNKQQLRDYLKELESNEEFERCVQVLKKINT